MKRISLIVVVLLCALISSTSYAQTLEEVTLTVSSDGPTKDEAVKNALRSAIEQAYGAFVSANTTILNDELVKDEIVTVSNGSIKNYKELSCTPTQNGGQNVILQATVSLPHLIKYSKNKGSECEFAGNTFGMEMKLLELNKKAELKALYNLTTQIVSCLPVVSHHVITVGEPKIPDARWSFTPEDLKACVEGNKYNCSSKQEYASSESATDESENLFSLPIFLRMDPSKKSKHYYPRAVGYLNKDAETIVLSTVEHINDYYEVPIDISWFPYEPKYVDEARKTGRFGRVEVGNTPLFSTIKSVLNSLSLTADERESMYSKRIPVTEFRMVNETFFLRNESDSIYKWAQDFTSKVYDEIFNFVIIDNTGQRSTFFHKDIVERSFTRDIRDIFGNVVEEHYPNEVSDKSPVMLSSLNIKKGWDIEGVLGEGLYHNLFTFEYSCSGYNVKSASRNSPWIEAGVLDGCECPILEVRYPHCFKTTVLIPKSEIGKYSNFRVEPANR